MCRCSPGRSTTCCFEGSGVCLGAIPACNDTGMPRSSIGDVLQAMGVAYDDGLPWAAARLRAYMLRFAIILRSFYEPLDSKAFED